MFANIQHVAGAVWAPQTDRGVMARLLFMPPLIGVLCIVWAYIAMHHGWIGTGVPALTGLPHVLMILAALGVFWSVACGVWYVLGVAWFLWSTRTAVLQTKTDPTAHLLRCLWMLPLISAAFCWIPVLVRASKIHPNVPHWALAIGMIVVQLLVTYAWIALARGLLRWKHGI